MAKFDKHSFIFDKKILLQFYSNKIYLTFKIEESCYFAYLSIRSRKMKKHVGFGNSIKWINPDWWKNFKWKEMSE